ncbi:MAG: bifunctional metallophosphatase/5'-nucleotidase [Prevotella sp.]|nr:bifunctional metallophosphatase/5'-nucleotidase [Prevotella sp.]
MKMMTGKYSFSWLLLTAAMMISCSQGKHIISQPTVEVSKEKSIVILFENDAHGNIDGYPKIAGLRDAIAQADTAWTALVSNGDYLSGGVACTLNKGRYIADIISSANYDVVTLGNHEYDFGMPRLLELLPRMTTSVVCANLHKYQDDIPMLQPFVIKSFGNKRVAFVGVNTPESMSSESYSFFDDEGKQLYDLKTDQVYELVQMSVNKARSLGADYVVVLAHLGEDDNETGITSFGLAAATRDIDAILDGHTHHVVINKYINDLDGKPVPVAQTGTQFANYGKLLITPDGRFIPSLIPASENNYVSMVVDETVNSVKNQMEQETKRVICTSDFELTINDADGNRQVRNGETNLANIVTDAYREALDADIGIQNGGGIRNSIKSGVITYGDVINALPFDNCMQKLEMTGSAIVSMLQEHIQMLPAENGSFLQVSGMRFTIHRGSRTISDVEVLDKATGKYQPIDPARVYTVGTIDYIAVAGLAKDYKKISGAKINYFDVVAKYLEKYSGGKVDDIYAKPQGRITFVE